MHHKVVKKDPQSFVHFEIMIKSTKCGSGVPNLVTRTKLPYINIVMNVCLIPGNPSIVNQYHVPQTIISFIKNIELLTLK